MKTLNFTAFVLQHQGGGKGSCWLDVGPNAHGATSVMAKEMLRLAKRTGRE